MGLKFASFKGIDTDDIVRQINKFIKNKQLDYVDLKLTSSAATEGSLSSMGGHIRYEQRTQAILIYREEGENYDRYNSL